jgi:hypothetical protein
MTIDTMLKHRAVRGPREGTWMCQRCLVRWPCLVVQEEALKHAHPLSRPPEEIADELPPSAGRLRLRMGLSPD